MDKVRSATGGHVQQSRSQHRSMKAKLAVIYIIGDMQHVPVGCPSVEELTLSLSQRYHARGGPPQYHTCHRDAGPAAGMSPLLVRIENRGLA